MGLLDFLFNQSSDDLDCDWYCDSCGAFLNSQSGFTVSSGIWTCEECGYENDVTEDNIVDGNDNYDDDDFDYYDYDDDDGEKLSVDEAAEIWISHGKDEDYTFGYTEEELEDALDSF